MTKLLGINRPLMPVQAREGKTSRHDKATRNKLVTDACASKGVQGRASSRAIVTKVLWREWAAAAYTSKGEQAAGLLL